MLDLSWYAVAAHGFGTSALVAALTVIRIGLGAFFAISGFHKLFNRERHATLVATLRDLNVPAVGFNQWFVPFVEFAGGIALVLGIGTPLAILGLLSICCVATCTDGLRRVRTWKPINRADWLDDVLYLPEVWYGLALLVILASGAGPYSVDALLIDWLS